MSAFSLLQYFATKGPVDENGERLLREIDIPGIIFQDFIFVIAQLAIPIFFSSYWDILAAWILCVRYPGGILGAWLIMDLNFRNFRVLFLNFPRFHLHDVMRAVIDRMNGVLGLQTGFSRWLGVRNVWYFGVGRSSHWLPLDIESTLLDCLHGMTVQWRNLGFVWSL